MSSNNAAAYLESPRAHPLVVKPATTPSQPAAGHIVIRAHSVAINPLDFLIQQTGMIVPETAYPFVLGNDIAGEVVQVGDGVSKVKMGDRVVACAENGCFQMYNTVEQTLVTKIPENVSYNQASVLPLALCTAAVMLFQEDALALDLPKVKTTPNGKVVVAWGGGSALGSNGIQMLKAAGYDVAAVAGSQNQQYCKDLGADYCFDHRAADVEEQIIKTLAGKPFAGVFCPIMSPETIADCARIADQLGDNAKNRIVATSLAHAMPYQGEVPEGVKIGYCESMAARSLNDGIR